MYNQYVCPNKQLANSFQFQLTRERHASDSFGRKGVSSAYLDCPVLYVSGDHVVLCFAACAHLHMTNGPNTFVPQFRLLSLPKWLHDASETDLP